ncbi:MAG TPA: hypothetical protein VGD98_23440 [Ktedonobacteraceae bacterium]
MTISLNAPWHKASFERFLHASLPYWLAEHLPLPGYTVTVTEQDTCAITLTLDGPAEDRSMMYTAIPQPTQEGIFTIAGKRLVVLPFAIDDDLEQAQIFCVGEQLEAYVRQRLEHVPKDLSWDAALAKIWLPLDRWITEFFTKPLLDGWWGSFVQPLDQTNWLATRSHVRRLAIKECQRLFAPGHFGRACPFETPEGPNIGRIIQLALGAEIREGKLLATDERPQAALGLAASMMPLLEHNAPQRLLMGTNMLRQWIAPSSPEPALIQSGNEPDAPDFWCGRNLLTAFISWGEDTSEDGIVLSASCVQRLSYEHPVEVGDTLSNRSGTKGVVSRILPDAEMPQLADGTPVELIFNFISQHARFSFGQIREAVLSRIVRVEGRAMIIPPFQAPDEQQIRARLLQAGLPEDGMEQLTAGQTGQPLAMRSTIGWVYWGKLSHEARTRLHISAGEGRGQHLTDYDYYALRAAGASEVIRELFNTSATSHSAAERQAKGQLEQAAAAAPQLRALLQQLAAMGIRGELREQELAFHLAEPAGIALDLAVPVAHPWLRDHVLTRIGVSPGGQPVYQALVEANVRLTHMLNSKAPESLRRQAQEQLVLCVHEYCATIQPVVQFETWVQWSGRAVLTPGSGLRLDQVGITEELAWSLFAPQLLRDLAPEEVQARSEGAVSMLDAIMARSWVILHRVPAFMPQTFLAFHPVRSPERVLRLHPLACRLLQADFDGDQAALFLLQTEQAQQEAGELLAVAGHLVRTPALLSDLLPNNEALWGLARLSLTQEGRQELAGMLGREIVPAGEIVTRTRLENALRPMLKQNDISKTIEMLEMLMQRGFASTRASGASLSPFVGSQFSLPPAPAEDESEAWQRYQQEASEWLAACTDYMHPTLGPQLLAVKSGARGEIEQLVGLLSTQGSVSDILGNQVPMRHGYRAGLQAAELLALAPGARESCAQVQRDWLRIMQEIRKRNRAESFHVLARAMRSEQPAMVFAHAASIGEIDPLTDPASRLFVGLPLNEE